MPRFAANLSMLYTEHAFLDRFAAAAADGFQAVEYLFPYDYPAAEIAARLKDHGLQQVLFNAPAGDWAAGERGLACISERTEEFRSGIAKALEYAAALDCPRIHVMAGIPPMRGPAYDMQIYPSYVSNLRWAAKAAARFNVTVLIEPINMRNMPGFFLNRQQMAHDVVQELGCSNLKVQFDLYHCQVTEGDLASKIREYLPTGRVGHIQIAGVPERHEPDVGELNYAYLFSVIDEVAAQCNWQGWVGCEYLPARGAVAGGTTDGLGWLREWLQHNPKNP